GHVEKITDARGLSALEQLLAGAGDEEGLHELLRHADVEELARLLTVAELDEPSILVERDVRERADRDLDRGIVLSAHAPDRVAAELFDLRDGLLRAIFAAGLGGLFRCHGFVRSSSELVENAVSRSSRARSPVPDRSRARPRSG